MLRKILLKVLAVSYALCTAVISSSESPDIFSTSIPLHGSHALYNTSYEVEPELEQALQKTYRQIPAEISHSLYVKHAMSYYSLEYPNLLKDSAYAFEILRTPIACVSMVRDLRQAGIATAIAVPSLTGGAWEHYEEIGLSSRFENIDKAKSPERSTFCLPVKVSAPQSFFDSLAQDKTSKVAFNKIVLIHFEAVLKSQPLIAFNDVDPEKTVRVELTSIALTSGEMRPVIIYSPLEAGTFRRGVPYAN